jgi:hypothetical protein
VLLLFSFVGRIGDVFSVLRIVSPTQVGQLQDKHAQISVACQLVQKFVWLEQKFVWLVQKCVQILTSSCRNLCSDMPSCVEICAESGQLAEEHDRHFI